MTEVRERFERFLELILGTVASLDFLVRFGDELLSFALASTSLAIGFDLLDVTQWLLFVVLVALFAPRFFPPPHRELADALSLRLAVAAASVAMAVPLTDLDGLDDVVAFVVVPLAFGGIIGVVLRLKGISLFDEEGPAVAGFDWVLADEGLAKAELERIRSYDGWLRTLGLGLFGVATLAPFVFPAIAAALVVTTLARTFPLPDLLVLTYVGGVFVARHSERLSSPPDALAIDDTLLTFARQATESTHGFFLVVLLGVGVFATVLMPIVVLRGTARLLGTALGAPVLPFALWNLVGSYLLLFAAVSYGLWFWLGMIPRITAFLERWNDQPIRTSPVARPRSVTVPSSVATGLATAGVAHGLVGPSRYVFVLVWPVALAGIGLVVRNTRRRHPSSIRQEDFFVVAAVLVAAVTIPGTLAVLKADLTPLLSPTTGLICGAVAFIGLFSRISRYSDRHDHRYGDGPDDERRFALAVYLVIGGLFGLLASGYIDGMVGTLVTVGGTLTAGFGLVLVVTRYYQL